MQKVLDKLSWLLLAFFIFYLDFSLQGVLLVRKNLRHIEADVMASLGFILVTIFIVLLLRLLKEPLSLKPLATTKFALYFTAFPAVMVINAIGGLVRTLLSNATTSANQSALNNLGMPFYLYFIMAVVFAPIVEETIFRKCLLEKVFGFDGWVKWVGWIVTGLLFGYIHLYTNLSDIGGWISYGGMGLVFGFVAMQSRRVEYSIAIHMIMNAFVVLISLLQ
ncbi:CPBP family intramembrane glutamic endopeptidase [Streptococcus downei]|uniref:CAAX amino terminal protease family protein n=1 Tax=Streptococcus downei MFe28 TaxID=764290 RepID=A0A380JB47_STRDO|nr:type II CAAX endopeptidase family protein [Streptococcus downei]EFQ57252.1 CAAX amino terminal protease family protein [Streptococcus downei F0415]SUN35202.1 CAAX amino terminal protease family protein [Streptococcus downei MFe28]